MSAQVGRETTDGGAGWAKRAAAAPIRTATVRRYECARQGARHAKKTNHFFFAVFASLRENCFFSELLRERCPANACCRVSIIRPDRGRRRAFSPASPRAGWTAP